MRILRGMMKRLRDADRQIESLALLDVRGRVARVLNDLAENVEGRRVIRKAPSRKDIAHMVGASREMVTRVMNDLKKSGRVQLDKRAIVLIC